MKSKTTFAIILITLLFVLREPGFTADYIALVLKVKGTVYILHGEDKASAVKPKRGFKLQDGDKIITDAKSYAAVRYLDDASTVRIRANSTCYIRGKKEKNEILKNVYLEVGTILARVTQQKGKFEVSTPTSVASVKGTIWITDQKPLGGKDKGKTLHYGLGGTVEVSNDGGTALLHEGETAEVFSKTTAPLIRKTVPGEVPSFDEYEETEDLFEFEFQNADGQRKVLKMKFKKAQEE
jgi:ferric-dicitrate binding protein FerR (iron transport regulator)